MTAAGGRRMGRSSPAASASRERRQPSNSAEVMRPGHPSRLPSRLGASIVNREDREAAPQKKPRPDSRGAVFYRRKITTTITLQSRGKSPGSKISDPGPQGSVGKSSNERREILRPASVEKHGVYPHFGQDRNSSAGNRHALQLRPVSSPRTNLATNA